ncbi:alpha-L-rhamnosidase [Paenibacillus marchantiophytorum]|uniref:alpha-L-rhamnosidase n=1 Tax=Paenibacillus marchantiophytorum TaxID=1619310 RepID=A0ABQ1EYS0_9BACL|nr:alpha-L-rhamnosidase [Paenibacillus marchantiophytorum]GFZ92038.1 alpha-L-rhamnosidase [Paenibacillus marchantiophytorum]
MTLRVTSCRTEYMHNPLGLDERKPRLFWKLASDARSAVQIAYQVLVARSEEQLNKDIGDIWDTGKVLSDQSTHIAYEGEPLETEGCYYWKVRVWGAADIVSDWSDPAFWTMGLLSRDEWKALWIGRKSESDLEMQPSPFFRKDFTVKDGVRRVTAYATALGVFELRVNGAPIGAHFAPGWTDYDTRVQVTTFDLTERIHPGHNAFGVILGDGWYAGTVGFLGNKVYGERPFFLMQVHIDYVDGTRDSVLTDASWKTSRGPIVYSDMILGETYDARLEKEGWDSPCYADADWETPDVRPGYNGLLVAAVEPPIRITETMRPLTVRQTAAGTYIYDMGQNMVGWTELRVKGERGTKVTVSHAEMLNPDGTMYLDNLRVAVQQENYILKGKDVEVYEPRFTFHGFRYVELIGYPGVPDLDSIVGKVVHSDTPVAGKLETSDERVNKLYANITWGQRGNFLSVPTDCPQRDERLGWTGDAQIFARTAAYNMDVSRFFSKFMWDMVDSQQPSGAFTDVAPDAGWIRHKMWNTRLNWFAPDNAGWGDAGVVIPWTLYLMYGDTRILATHYEAMVRWVHYLKANTTDLVRPNYANYGDWLSIEADTPNEVLATAYFAYSTKLLAQIARVLGKSEDAAKYGSLFEDIALAFRKAFVNGEGRIHGGTQTVYVLALQFGLLTDTLRDQAVDHLVADIQQRGDRLSTGFLGVGYLLPALTEHGRLDVAYKLLTQEEFPSWMYSIKHGATTIWERWDGWTEEMGFQTPQMNSFNHYSLGSVGEWMFRYMAGIDTDPVEGGFRHTVIKPQPGGELTNVTAQYESLYGTIAIAWHVSGSGQFHLKVNLPANTSATVYLPGDQRRMDGIPVAEKDRLTPYRIGSGEYVFECTMPK